MPWKPAQKSSHLHGPLELIRSPHNSLSHLMRNILKNVIHIILLLAALVSIILFAVGLLTEHHASLTAGCILGLACFGALLHACFYRRSSPSPPIHLSVSTACIHPSIDGVYLTADFNAAATAVVTAALLPLSFKATSSRLTSVLGVAIGDQMDKRQFSPLETTDQLAVCPTSTSEVPIPFNSNQKGEDFSSAQRRPDSYYNCHHQLDRPTIDYPTQHTYCPPVNAEKLNNSLEQYLYVNDPPAGEFESTNDVTLFANCFEEVHQTNPYHPNRTHRTQVESDSSQSAHSDYVCESQMTEAQPTKNMYFQSSQRRNQSPRHMEVYPASSAAHSQRSHSPSLATTITVTPRRLPQVSHTTPLHLRYLHWGNLSSAQVETNGDLAGKFLQLFHQPNMHPHANRIGIRHDREREGLFGPPAWRSWRSWVDY
ncbi:unnamed protein product [Dicrocoelium dendriticum]|nr:unnamed protein product [Dicrocoelium dendriticum]